MTRPRRSVPLLLAGVATLALVSVPCRLGIADGAPAHPGKAAEPPKPADPAKPAEPPKPADPTKPAEPPKPADPAKPTDPPKPPDAPKPEPPKPGDPAKPAAPAAAVNPKDIEALQVHGRVVPWIVQPPAARETVALADALKEADGLKNYLKSSSKSNNQDILASLDAMAKAYHNLGPDGAIPDLPSGVAPADEAGKKAWDDAVTAHNEAKAKFEAARKDFRKTADKLFLDALKLVHIKAGQSANERDDVNIRAAQILAFCYPKEKDLSDDVIKILENNIFNAKYDPPSTLYDEVFKTIAILNDHAGGLKEFMDWVKYSNNKGDPEKIKAMFSAVVEFRDKEWKDTLPGADRKAFVEKALRTFVGTESAAERGKTKEEQAQKQVWDKIKAAVYKALQWACKEPKAKDGALVAKLKDFDAWLKDHDNKKDPAWADPPKIK